MSKSSTRILLALAVGVLIVVAQNAAVAAQGAFKKVPYDQLSDYVNDWDNRRDGERLIVTDVPMPTKIEFVRSSRMYMFDPSGQGDIATSFYTSRSVTNVLRPYLDSATSSLRITCTLIQFAGEFDVFRSPFATKIEGLDENDKVMWTAAGTPPAKLKFKQ